MAALTAACSPDESGTPGGSSASPSGGSGSGNTGSGAGPSFPPYATMDELHERALAPTCSLNNGVCHNSKEYPDTHTPSNVLALVRQPCNMSALTHGAVHDVCEPKGDRLVIPSAGIDAEIARVAVSPPDVPTADLTEVKVELAGPIASMPAQFAGDAVVRRGEAVFNVGAAGASVIASDSVSVTFELNAEKSVKTFFDDRTYPWHDLMIRVADVNANGVLGGSMGVSLIEPGDPMKSYMILRLIDTAYGDLMPRQCREWDDQATRALGCWIQGLKVNEGGEVLNADDPINYDDCTFDPAGKGKCGAGGGIDEVFAKSCGGAKCHVGEVDPAAMLDLSPGKAALSLVGVASTQVPSMNRVESGKPDESYLLCKVVAECSSRVGGLMPSGAPPLPADDIEAIRAWIAAGAPSE
jgi:hypothetical protein